MSSLVPKKRAARAARAAKVTKGTTIDYSSKRNNFNYNQMGATV
jgi:hypothetical protein